MSAAEDVLRHLASRRDSLPEWARQALAPWVRPPEVRPDDDLVERVAVVAGSTLDDAVFVLAGPDADGNVKRRFRHYLGALISTERRDAARATLAHSERPRSVTILPNSITVEFGSGMVYRARVYDASMGSSE